MTPTLDKEPPVSPYRVGPWTVRKLKDELRSLSLPMSGNKDELIKRLESASEGKLDSAKKSEKTKSSPPVNEVVEEKSDDLYEHYSQFTITQLQKELKSRQLAHTGRKDALILRLVEDDSNHKSPLQSPIKSPTKKNPSPTKSKDLHESFEALEATQMPKVVDGVYIKKDKTKKEINEDVSKMTIFNSPLKVLGYSFMYFATRFSQFLKYLVSHKILSSIIAVLLSVLVALNFAEGPHQAAIRHFEKLGFWYGRWFILGVLSSIGLGTGAHTFLLFLGPFIAEVTTAAYTCKSLDFLVEGEGSFICPGTAQSALLTLWQIANKVKWESFLWGAGTAFGELPPYFIAKATALAGKSSGEIAELNELQKKPKETLTFSEKTHLWMFYLVQYLGFVGILLCASIPNPLFDLAGITCGYFQVPFWTFWSATFIGKACFKAGIQTLFVVLLFSKENIEFVIHSIAHLSPQIGQTITTWLDNQKSSFLRNSVPVASNDFNLVAFIWNAILFVMLGYFVLSILQSVAVIYAKELKKKKK